MEIWNNKLLGGKFTKLARAFSKNYNVIVNLSGLKACTDGQTINIPANADFLDGADQRVLEGILDHEWSHVAEETEAKERGEKTPMEYFRDCRDNTEKMMLNVFEDIRIELKQAARYPGVADNLRANNEHCVKIYLDHAKRARRDFWQLLGAAIIFRARGIAIESWASEELITLVDEVLADEMRDAQRQKSVADAYSLAIRTIKKIKDLKKEADKESEPEESDNDDGEGAPGDGDQGDSEPEESDGGESGSDDDQSEGDEEQGEGDEEQGEGGSDDEGDAETDCDGGAKDENGDDGESDEEGGAGDEEGDSDEQGDEEGDTEEKGDEEGEGDSGEGDEEQGNGGDVEEASSDVETGGEDDGGKKEIKRAYVKDIHDLLEGADEECRVQDMMDYNKEQIQAAAESDAASNGRYIPHPEAVKLDAWIRPEQRPSDKEKYAKRKDKADKAISAMRAKMLSVLRIATQSYWAGDREEGQLDAASLASLRTGNRRVFAQHNKGQSLDTVVSILVDQSGSMGYASGRSRSYYAQIASIALCETLNSLNIPFELIGFDNEYEKRVYGAHLPGQRVEPLRMVEYVRFGDNYRARAPSLVQITGNGNNTDGEALYKVAERVARRKEARKIIIVLSDGYPCAEGDQRLFNSHLKTVVRAVSAAGIEVLGIGIQSDSVRHFYNKETGAEWAMVNDLSELAPCVLKMFRKKMLGANGRRAA